jgi:hypothetical protein
MAQEDEGRPLVQLVGVVEPSTRDHVGVAVARPRAMPFCFSAEPAGGVPTPSGVGGAPMRPKLEPDRAGSRRRCRCVPLLAAARRAGAVSTRYSLPRRPFANVGVAGSSPVSCSR